MHHLCTLCTVFIQSTIVNLTSFLFLIAHMCVVCLDSLTGSYCGECWTLSLRKTALCCNSLCQNFENVRSGGSRIYISVFLGFNQRTVHVPRVIKIQEPFKIKMSKGIPCNNNVMCSFICPHGLKLNTEVYINWMVDQMNVTLAKVGKNPITINGIRLVDMCVRKFLRHLST